MVVSAFSLPERSGIRLSGSRNYPNVNCIWVLESSLPGQCSYSCSFTDHELLTEIRDSCVVTNEPFLYRLKGG